jgi:AcrR family transcriptional regulator
MRLALVDIAARLLHEEGPQGLSARRLAAEADCSTMMVYTHFGGMSGLVREIVHEGFARLQHYFSKMAPTEDPVADMALLGRAYRFNAITNPHLYAAMFGAAPLSSFSLSEADRRYGRYTLVNVVYCASRCIAAERFLDQDAELVAHQMWSAIHGLVTLELGGYLVEPYDADCCFEAQLTALMVSVGDGREAALKSVEVSRRRLYSEIETRDRGDAGPGSTAPG